MVGHKMDIRRGDPAPQARLRRARSWRALASALVSLDDVWPNRGGVNDAINAAWRLF